MSLSEYIKSGKFEEERKESTGGFIIPQVAYIDVAKDGYFWYLWRLLGQSIINFGAWFRSFGYSKREIYPYTEIIKSIAKGKDK